ncbi:hypothetical protein D9611_006819 [Ephemerocybe angulata]|uniref:Uncharacterized protein n=2 Tax=Ephemerocybe angulata TaxID=980116 RepID=A0A8H6MEU1_9AGAR|nr:hypothetical protein D9611_006819 [Tulosesus angulatus]KAF6766025.1 hypothetical protein DFP72DRAFT_1057218 [Tulosesus angulatus]
MDFIRSLDSSKLLQVGVGLSFVLSTYPSSSYNFPLFLFGSYIQESTEAIQSLTTFTVLIAVSALFDLFTLFSSDYSIWTKIILLALIALKVPTFFAFSASLRQRGGEFSLGVGGPNLSGPTLWSMPGGFTSSGNDRYQTADDDASFVRASRPPAPAPAQPAPGPPSTAPPGAYQVV